MFAGGISTTSLSKRPSIEKHHFFSGDNFQTKTISKKGTCHVLKKPRKSPNKQKNKMKPKNTRITGGHFFSGSYFRVLFLLVPTSSYYHFFNGVCTVTNHKVLITNLTNSTSNKNPQHPWRIHAYWIILVYFMYILPTYIYQPRTQMTLVLIGKGLVLGGFPCKNRGHWGSRKTYIYNKKPTIQVVEYTIVPWILCAFST